MKLYLQHHDVRSSNAVDTWVEDQILALGRTRHIDEANIRLARHRDTSPAYHVRVHLVTPGPDVLAEAQEHTLTAAVTKVVRQLRAEIARRSDAPARRLKSNLSRRTMRTSPADRGTSHWRG